MRWWVALGCAMLWSNMNLHRWFELKWSPNHFGQYYAICFVHRGRFITMFICNIHYAKCNSIERNHTWRTTCKMIAGININLVVAFFYTFRYLWPFSTLFYITLHTHNQKSKNIHRRFGWHLVTTEPNSVIRQMNAYEQIRAHLWH